MLAKPHLLALGSCQLFQRFREGAVVVQLHTLRLFRLPSVMLCLCRLCPTWACAIMPLRHHGGLRITHSNPLRADRAGVIDGGFEGETFVVSEKRVLHSF